VAFPSLSTGAYRYPIRDAARIALKTVVEYLKTDENLTLIRFVLFGEEAYRVYAEALSELTA
jgi:O-acetyl-ADP-ribose deacetylase (regulator of RNase III)